MKETLNIFKEAINKLKDFNAFSDIENNQKKYEKEWKFIKKLSQATKPADKRMFKRLIQNACMLEETKFWNNDDEIKQFINNNSKLNSSKTDVILKTLKSLDVFTKKKINAYIYARIIAIDNENIKKFEEFKCFEPSNMTNKSSVNNNDFNMVFHMLIVPVIKNYHKWFQSLTV